MSLRHMQFQCPECAGAVEAAGALLACRNCGQAWPITAGVASFGQSAAFPQDLPDAGLDELLAVAESSGWQVAMHDYLRPLDPALYRRAVDEYRAQWRCLLPRHPQARLLDFRCGWGTVPLTLAPDYGLVAAADTRYELARFTAIRAEAAGARNLQALCLNPEQRLPFPDGYFDVVALHDALEWGAPRRLLAEVARVTAPGGSLFVSAANRLAPNGLAASLKPGGARPMALAGYRRALAQAGFVPGPAYALLPSPAEPFYLVPLAGRASLRYFLNSAFDNAALRVELARRRLLAPFLAARAAWRAARLLPIEGLARYLLPGYGLLATRVG